MTTKLNLSTKALTDTHPGLRVEVYRNLRTGRWSVRALEGPHRGLVIAHKSDFILEACSYAVQPAGRDKVRRTGRKNVHAFIRGRVPESVVMMFGREPRRVTYNPYEHDGFVLESIATDARLGDDGRWCRMGTPKWLDAGESWVGQSSAVRFCADGRVLEGFACEAARWGALFA
jgi:hypothetical protein